MTEEQRLFLSLLRDHVNGTMTAEITGQINWEDVYAYAKDQSLLGICYIQLKKLKASGSMPEDGVFQKFHEGFLYDAYFAVNHKAFMNDLIIEFEKRNIHFLPFKGWITKECWPIPGLRTMGDVDILIHTKDREATDAVMKSLGYDRLIDNHAVWTYYQKDMTVELHDHMFYEHLMNSIDYIGYFDHAWEHCKPHLDENFHFLYMITHMAKHTINKGMGFRAYLDLIFFCQANKEKLDWNWICTELEKLELFAFTETCFAFCKAWFDYAPPIAISELDQAFYSFVTEKLFQDGTFGLENTQNEAANSAKEIAHSGTSYALGALGVMRKRLFPPYEDMQLIPWYSFVDGRPWLLPAAWVYRWGYCLLHKRKQGQDLLTEPVKKKGIIEKRSQLMQDWGLYIKSED